MTVRQKQHLLAFLGYYRAAVDDIWGPRSRQATMAFQQDHMDRQDGIFDVKTEQRIREVIGAGKEEPSFWQQIRYFSRSEFACRCGTCGGFPAEPREDLVKLADRVRWHFDSPVTVSSGVRCASHNAAVGGVVNSRHLTGSAVDFAVRGKSAAAVLSWLQQQPEVRYCYAIDETYVHMDIG